MEGKEFTVEIFEKALEIYRELPKEKRDLIIEALTMINRHSHSCELRARRIARGRIQEKVKEYLPQKEELKSENSNH